MDAQPSMWKICWLNKAEKEQYVGICAVQDVGAKSKDFNDLSGKYTMELIVGDAVIENPITWLMVSTLLNIRLIIAYALKLIAQLLCFGSHKNI